MRTLWSTVMGWVATPVLLGVLAAPMAAGVGAGWREVQGSKLRQLSAAEVRESKVLSQYIKSLEGKSDKAIIYRVKGPVSEVTSDALATLFPKWKFYVVPYEMKKNPNYKKPVAIPGGMYNALGVNGRDEPVEFAAYGDHEDFGKALAANKIPLSNAKEGRLIWLAACQLLRKGWVEVEPRQAAPDVWHLGLQVTGDFEYFYEVRTDEDGIVSSGKYQAKPVKTKKD